MRWIVGGLALALCACASDAGDRVDQTGAVMVGGFGSGDPGGSPADAAAGDQAWRASEPEHARDGDATPARPRGSDAGTTVEDAPDANMAARDSGASEHGACQSGFSRFLHGETSRLPVVIHGADGIVVWSTDRFVRLTQSVPRDEAQLQWTSISFKDATSWMTVAQRVGDDVRLMLYTSGNFSAAAHLYSVERGVLGMPTACGGSCSFSFALASRDHMLLQQNLYLMQLGQRVTNTTLSAFDADGATLRTSTSFTRGESVARIVGAELDGDVRYYLLMREPSGLPVARGIVVLDAELAVIDEWSLPSDVLPVDAELGTDGTLIVLGSRQAGDGAHVWLQGLDARSGAARWPEPRGDGAATPGGVDVAPDGRIAVTGGRAGDGGPMFLMLYDAQGEALWSESPSLGEAVVAPEVPAAGSAVSVQSDGSLLVRAGATIVRYRSCDVP